MEIPLGCVVEWEDSGDSFLFNDFALSPDCKNKQQQQQNTTKTVLGHYLIVPIGIIVRDCCGYWCLNTGLMLFEVIPIFSSFSPDSSSVFCISARGENDSMLPRKVIG